MAQRVSNVADEMNVDDSPAQKYLENPSGNHEERIRQKKGLKKLRAKAEVVAMTSA